MGFWSETKKTINHPVLSLKGLCFLLLCLLSPNAFAAIFDVASTDKSQEYLSMIFGNQIGGLSLSGNHFNPTLSLMFEKFNFIIVTIGSVVLGYIAILSTFNTAKEGEALGKKLSGWVITRAVGGMLLMIPTPASGYSLVQMTVMWIVLNGIGAANAVWNVVLDQLAEGVSVVTTNVKQPFQVSPDQIAETIGPATLNAMTCMYSLNRMADRDTAWANSINSPFLVNNNVTLVTIYTEPSQYSPLLETPNAQGFIGKTRISVGIPGHAMPGYARICGSFEVSTSLNKEQLPPDAALASVIQERLRIKTEALMALFTVLSPTAYLLSDPTPTLPEMPALGTIHTMAVAYVNKLLEIQNGTKVTAGVQSPVAMGQASPDNRIAINTVPSHLSLVKTSTPSSLEQSIKGSTLTLFNTAKDALANSLRVPLQHTYRWLRSGSRYYKTLQKLWGYFDATPARVSLIGPGDVTGAASKGTSTTSGAVTSGTNFNPSTSIIAGAIQQLRTYGWIHAGSYYFRMIQAQQKTTDPEIGKMTTILPRNFAVPLPYDLNSGQTVWPTADGDLNSNALNTLFGVGSENNAIVFSRIGNLNWALVHAAGYYMLDINNNKPAMQGITSTERSFGNKFIDLIISTVRKKIHEPVLEYVQTVVDGDGGDPLVSIGGFGTILLWAAEMAVIGSIILSIVLSLVGSAMSCVSPFAWTLNFFALQILPLIYGVGILLWTAGATLGIYIPMIPYLIFTTSAFGWIISVIEAMVGAPLIALSMTQPSGEELGKVGSALVILANLFLRPTLMIFGFVLGTALLRAGIALVNFGFIPALNEATSPSLFSILAILMMYMFLIMAIINKSFSLIYLLPNQIMRWMGGPTEQSDPSDMMKEAKGGFESGDSKSRDMAQQAQKSAGERNQARKDATDKKK